MGGLGQILGMLILWGQGRGRGGGWGTDIGDVNIGGGGGGVGDRNGYAHIMGVGVLGQTLGMLIFRG